MWPSRLRAGSAGRKGWGPPHHRNMIVGCEAAPSRTCASSTCRASSRGRGRARCSPTSAPRSIKVERPRTGDETRGWGPPVARGRGRGARTAAYFASTNRGKRSVTVDLSRPRARPSSAASPPGPTSCSRTTRSARSRVRPRLRRPRRVNPRLVYCSISGFGQDGPYRDRPGYDFLVQAMGGLMSVTGEPDGVPGGGP